MTTDERKRLILAKLAASQQRLLAQKFLARLSPAIRAALETAPLIGYPQSEEIARYQIASAKGIGRDPALKPNSFFFAPFRSPDEVLAALARYAFCVGDQPAYFRPRGHYGYFDVSRTAPLADPMFQVSFRWACAHFRDLYEAAGHVCGLSTGDGKSGIVTYVVCGYHDRHADEEVFELAQWSDAT